LSFFILQISYIIKKVFFDVLRSYINKLCHAVDLIFNNALHVYEQIAFYIDIRCFLSMKEIAYSGVSGNISNEETKE